MKILYSFNKTGFEERFWTREVAAASSSDYQFIPFNHGAICNPMRYLRAQALDNLYFDEDPSLLSLYRTVGDLIEKEKIDVLFVDNCFPYHPEFLRRLNIYKVIRTTDGPISAYDRDLAYLHAYDHVLYHTPAYSRDLTMAEKLAYCGAKRADFLPLGLFDVAFRPDLDEDAVMRQARSVDLVFVGGMVPGKFPILASVKKKYGSRCRMHGLTNWKRNAYFNVKYGFPGWIRPIRFEDYVPLYQRSKIGFNVHNRGDYTVGNYRLYELAANGVMQISDGGVYLQTFFEPGEEIVAFTDADDLVEKINRYLADETERCRIARNAYRRVIRDYRFKHVMGRAVDLIAEGMRGKGGVR